MRRLLGCLTSSPATGRCRAGVAVGLRPLRPARNVRAPPNISLRDGNAPSNLDLRSRPHLRRVGASESFSAAARELHPHDLGGELPHLKTLEDGIGTPLFVPHHPQRHADAGRPRAARQGRPDLQMAAGSARRARGSAENFEPRYAGDQPNSPRFHSARLSLRQTDHPHTRIEIRHRLHGGVKRTKRT